MSENTVDPLSYLDNPVWHSLATRHAALGMRNGSAACYRSEISPIAGLAETTPAALEDLSKLARPGRYLLVLGIEETGLEEIGVEEMGADHLDVGPWFRRAEGLELAQMVCEAELAPSDLELATLGPDDVDDVMELVALTAPGPFERGTLEMGRYLGLREGGRLMAMAGERMKPTGATEISAVCTHPDAQGRGLGEALVRAIAAPIQRAGDVAFLHVHAANRRAIRLYERLGFRRRATRVISPIIRLG